MAPPCPGAFAALGTRRLRILRTLYTGQADGAPGAPALALTYPEYAKNAKKVRLIETTAQAYYGKGYQDAQNRVPKIDLTCRDLDWKLQVTMKRALMLILDA